MLNTNKHFLVTTFNQDMKELGRIQKRFTRLMDFNAKIRLTILFVLHRFERRFDKGLQDHDGL